MTLLEVAKHALEAMEDAMYRADTHEFYDAKESLRYAIEQAEQAEQEPVAWMFQHEETGRTMCVDAQQVEWGFEKGNPRLKKIAPLYTAPTPRQWVGLTDEEIDVGLCRSPYALQTAQAWRDGVEWAQEQLKEKNT